MSSISNAGIFIDIKQLLQFTHVMKKEMSAADKEDYGHMLTQYNLDMIKYFTMAWHRRDEHIIFEADGKTYDVNLRGEKRTYVDALEAACFTSARRSRRKSPLWEWNDYPDYKSVYNRPDGIGGFIGYTFWQTVASLYPTDADRYVAECMSEHFVRYVDDTAIVTDNKEMALAAIPGLRRVLRQLGVTLHPKKFYCQPYEHGVEFLGYHIVPPDRIHLKNETISRAMLVAQSHGRGKDSYVNAINSYLGMIKGTSDIAKARKLLDLVNRHGVEKDYKELKVKKIERF